MLESDIVNNKYYLEANSKKDEYVYIGSFLGNDVTRRTRLLYTHEWKNQRKVGEEEYLDYYEKKYGRGYVYWPERDSKSNIYKYEDNMSFMAGVIDSNRPVKLVTDLTIYGYCDRLTGVCKELLWLKHNGYDFFADDTDVKMTIGVRKRKQKRKMVYNFRDEDAYLSEIDEIISSVMEDRKKKISVIENLHKDEKCDELTKETKETNGTKQTKEMSYNDHDLFNENGDRLCQVIGCRKNTKLILINEVYLCKRHKQLDDNKLKDKKTETKTAPKNKILPETNTDSLLTITMINALQSRKRLSVFSNIMDNDVKLNKKKNKDELLNTFNNIMKFGNRLPIFINSSVLKI